MEDAERAIKRPWPRLRALARDLSRALGKPVEYRPQSFEEFERDFGPTRAAFFEVAKKLRQLRKAWIQPSNLR